MLRAIAVAALLVATLSACASDDDAVNATCDPGDRCDDSTASPDAAMGTTGGRVSTAPDGRSPDAATDAGQSADTNGAKPDGGVGEPDARSMGETCATAQQRCTNDPNVEVDCATFDAAPDGVKSCVAEASTCDEVIGCVAEGGGLSALTCTGSPAITFVIDGSGSMCAAFEDTTRWGALRDALLDPSEGLFYRLQDQAQLGVVVYDGNIDITLASSTTAPTPGPACSGFLSMGTGSIDCPRVFTVNPALDNASTIDSTYPTTLPGGSTPTHAVMSQAVDAAIQRTMERGHAESIVLITDGVPTDICIGGAGGDSTAQQNQVFAHIDRAANSGVSTYVIGLYGDDAVLESFVDTSAQHGTPADPDASAYKPKTRAELRAALDTVANAACAP
jgi:hypothetical protein